MKFRPTTVRGQMLYAIGALVVLVQGVPVLATLTLAHQLVYALAERALSDQVESIAARARFAAIVGINSPEVAKQLLEEYSGTSGFEASELVNSDGRRIAALESKPHSLSVCQFTPSSKTTLTRVGANWCVTSPILVHSQIDACTAAQCLIGHLHVVASTTATDTAVRRLLEAIELLGGALLLATLISLWRISADMTRPLLDIVAVMRRFSAGDRTARAIEAGPEEMITISKVYNDLIDAQEAHARTLEHKVEERTRRLNEATLAAQDAERYKTTFMAHVSHDMRTPLHVIRAQTSEVINELEFGADIARARAPLEIIQRECDELSFRVSQVLELMRGDIGPAEVYVSSVSLDELRTTVRQKTKALAQRNRNRFVIVGDSGTLHTDVDKALQIIINLVDNACKFTKDGSVEIALRLREPGLHIDVTDSGVGIPASLLPTIWSEFRPLPSPGGRRIGGFGLGLAIVRHYTTQLGGRYGADSVEGQGTHMWVILPNATALSVSSREGGVREQTTTQG